MKSYLRFLSRNKLYTAIEVVGLSIALAFVLLIGTFVWQQYSVGRKVKDFDRIWSVGMNNFDHPRTGLYLGAADVMKANIPEIELAGSHYDQHMDVITFDGMKIHASGIGVDLGFFQIFEPEFISGSYEVLNDLSNAIVSASFAEANGGPAEVVGKAFNYNGYEFTVAAVVEDFKHSLFPYCDILININSDVNAGRKQWKYICDITPFLKVKEGVDRDVIIAKLGAEVERMVKEDIVVFKYEGSIVLDYKDMLFSEYSTRLNKADKESLRIMLLAVILLLMSAIINFVNLNSAMSGKRIKEMATRMVLGTEKRMIFIRYLLESVIICLFCGGIAILIAVALEPYANSLIQSDIPISISLSPASILFYIIIVSGIGAVSGIIPAGIGTSADPVEILKGKASRDNKRLFGKVFIGLQNTISIVLIAMAITMELQMKHLTDRPVGADISDLYYLYIDNLNDRSTIENALRALPCVEEIGISEGYPGKSSEVLREAKDGTTRFGMIRCDSTAFSLYGFQRKSSLVSSVNNSVWMTQRSLDSFGLNPESPEMLQRLPSTSNSTFGGVLEEYAAFDVLKDNSNAISFIQVFGSEGFTPFMSSGGGLLIRTNGDHKDNRDAIEDTYRKYIEEKTGIYSEPYEYGYIKDLHQDTLKDVSNNMRIMEIFMFLSILLSFMGLVAMSSYFSSENTSDIAIRKIYGSTARAETLVSTWRYMRIVLVSCIIALPIAVYACGRYLEEFVYRIDNKWWVYALAMAISVIISISAVFVQVSRAARTDPAEALKKE